MCVEQRALNLGSQTWAFCMKGQFLAVTWEDSLNLKNPTLDWVSLRAWSCGDSESPVRAFLGCRIKSARQGVYAEGWVGSS